MGGILTEIDSIPALVVAFFYGVSFSLFVALIKYTVNSFASRRERG